MRTKKKRTDSRKISPLSVGEMLVYLTVFYDCGALLEHLEHFQALQSLKPLRFQHSLSHRFHRGEEQDIADAVGIGEQHYEAVEAEAQAA